MALRALLLRKKLTEMQTRMEQLAAKTAEFTSREAELTAAMEEATTEEQLRSVEELVETYTAEQRDHQSAVDALQAEIDAANEELRTLEAQTPPPATAPQHDERKDDRPMTTRQLRAFGSMNVEQRTAFIQREDVHTFVDNFRARFMGGQRRSVTGGDLLIPEVLLDLIRENILDYSKLLRRVRVVPVSGTARQPIMGTIPEAVWTEACGALNELQFSINEVEVDGYKVGGYVSVCNATLEDSDGVLLAAIIEGMGVAIGIALDKAILFGTGVKMPLGIATRLAQKSQPEDYPANARPWVDLSSSNIITVPSESATGKTLFQQLVLASGAAKGRYSRGEWFWAMNEATHTKVVAEAANVDGNGAIVSVTNGTMPIVGGDLVVFSDDVIPANTIIAGYGDLYLLAERAGTSVGYSDLPLYIQDRTVVKGTARYDGLPVIAEGFVAIGLGTAPTTSMSFAQDVANPSVAALQSLTIGALELTPAFAVGTDTYTATTSNASDVLSAVPTMGSTLKIKLAGKTLQNGAPVYWNTGENVVTITVVNGANTKTYTVTVTKNGG